MGFFILVARFTSLGYLSYLTHFFSTVYFDFVARFSSLGCLSSLAHSVPVVHFLSMVYFILMVHLDLLGVFNDSGSLVTTGFSFRFRLAQFGWVTLAIWLT